MPLALSRRHALAVLAVAVLPGLASLLAPLAGTEPSSVLASAVYQTEPNPLAASDLAVEQRCSAAPPRSVVATFTWTPAATRGQAQQLVVSIMPDGLDRGVFALNQTLPPDQSIFAWPHRNPGVLHSWRVLTLQPGGWVASETAEFSGRTCPVDFVPTPSQPPGPR